MLPIFGTLISLGNKVADIIDKHVSNKDEREKLKLEFQKQYALTLAQIQEQLLKSQGDIIVAEATGHSWLQRNWRPITMLVFVFIIANNYVLVPYAHAIFDFNLPVLQLPDQVWELIKYGLTGYIGARSVEKIVTTTVAAKTKRDILNHVSKILPSKESDNEPKKIPKVTDINLSIPDE